MKIGRPGYRNHEASYRVSRQHGTPDTLCTLCSHAERAAGKRVLRGTRTGPAAYAASNDPTCDASDSRSEFHGFEW